MNELPPAVPRINPLPFLVVDGVLLTVAAGIGWQASTPLGLAPLAAITVLVGLGAIAALYPFVANFNARQEEALQDRADQIAALARTVGASSEQISIAVASLPAISEQSALQLKAAEQLPAKLQSRLAEFQRQFNVHASEESAALRTQLDALRSAGTNQLGIAIDSLTHCTGELLRLEVLAAKHSRSLDASVVHLSRLADVLSQEIVTGYNHETTSAIATFKTAVAESSAAITAVANETQSAFKQALADVVTQLAAQASHYPALPAPVSATSQHALVVETTLLVTPPPLPLAPTPASALYTPATSSVGSSTGIRETGPVLNLPPAPLAPEPTPVVVQAVPDTKVVLAEMDKATKAAAASITSEAAPAIEVAAKPEIDAEAQTENPPSVESALTNDGYTRLIATAYLGIGHRLFIRGDGPGLRRDKGVPLQFIAIGKWRWENAELLFPATVMLYKNDLVACTSLGELTLEPGYQHQVNAVF
jgi:hypothetical protein